MSKSLSFRLRLSSVMDVMTKTAMEEICKIVDSDFTFVRQELSRVMSENAALKDKVLCLGNEEPDESTRIAKKEARAAYKTYRSVCVQTDDGEEPSIKGIFGKDWCSSLWERRNEPNREERVAIDVDMYSLSVAPYKHKELSHQVIIKEENFEVDTYPSCTGIPSPVSRVQLPPSAYKPSKNNFVSCDFSEMPEMHNAHSDLSDEHLTESALDDTVDQLIAPIDDPLEYDAHCFLSSQYSEERNTQFDGVAPEMYIPTTTKRRGKRLRVPKRSDDFSRYDVEDVFLQQNAGKNRQRKNRFPKIKTKEKFRCEVCGRCFHSNTNLSVHYAVHTGEKPYICSFCGKGFSQKGNLQAHERIHRGEKPFCCVICGRRFTQKVCLRNHERIHRGEKPFTCMTCGKGFTQKVTLQQHIAVHDKTTKRVKRKPRKNCDLDFHVDSFM